MAQVVGVRAASRREVPFNSLVDPSEKHPQDARPDGEAAGGVKVVGTADDETRIVDVVDGTVDVLANPAPIENKFMAYDPPHLLVESPVHAKLHDVSLFLRVAS